MEHVSVLRKDVQKYLDLKEGEAVIDATLGLGGHSKDILERIGRSGKLYAFDQDERNLKEAKWRLKEYEKQVEYINDNFRYLKNRITGEVDAALFDLGLSSPHIDEADRGFSFMREGPLDMRFDPRAKLTARDVVNFYDEEDLMRIFWEYGEEKMGRKLARKIVERRKEQEFETTVELGDFIEKNYPKKRSSKKSSHHPATKVFQAIRMEVNDEMEALKEGLLGAMERIKIGGRIVVITYHSIEDRVVKQFFKALLQPEAKGEKAIYQNFDDPIVKKLAKKPVVPSQEEIEENPRSRSAKLRAYKKVKTL